MNDTGQSDSPYNPHYLHCCEQVSVNPDSKAMQKIYGYAYRNYHQSGVDEVTRMFVELIELFKEVRG